MYFYKIGYGTYEESLYREYYSDTELTKEELETIFLKSVKEYLIDNKENLNLLDYESFMDGEYDSEDGYDRYRLLNIEDIFYLKGLNTYLDKNGLHELEYTTKRLSYFGWCSLKGDSFENEKDDAEKKLISVVNEVFEEK